MSGEIDGLFETLRVDHGEALDVAAHLDRLFAGLPRTGIALPESRGELAETIAKAAARAPRPVARLRLTVSRGPTVRVTTEPYSPPSEEDYRDGVPILLLTDLRIGSNSPLAGLKSLPWEPNRQALRRAEAAGAFEALLLNERGRLAEGARSNLVLALPDGLFTPPESDGCLPGTIRRRLLEGGWIAERSLTPDDLQRARETVLLNSLIGALAVKGRKDEDSVADWLRKKIARSPLNEAVR
ncbi:MAG TPA: aminotransferase class IV [Thermoanaerobaculia bacterium]